MNAFKIFARIVDEKFFLGVVHAASETAALDRAEQLYASHRRSGHLMAKRQPGYASY